MAVISTLRKGTQFSITRFRFEVTEVYDDGSCKIELVQPPAPDIGKPIREKIRADIQREKAEKEEQELAEKKAKQKIISP